MSAFGLPPSPPPGADVLYVWPLSCFGWDSWELVPSRHLDWTDVMLSALMLAHAHRRMLAPSWHLHRRSKSPCLRGIFML